MTKRNRPAPEGVDADVFDSRQGIIQPRRGPRHITPRARFVDRWTDAANKNEE